VPPEHLRAGENELLVKVFNAATRTGWPAQKREGWHYHVLFRTDQQQCELSVGQRKARAGDWGTWFTVAKKTSKPSDADCSISIEGYA